MATSAQQLQSLGPSFAAARTPAAPRPLAIERTLHTHLAARALQRRRAASAGRDAPARNRPDDAGLSTVQLLHTNARALRLPLHGAGATHKCARPRTPDELRQAMDGMAGHGPLADDEFQIMLEECRRDAEIEEGEPIKIDAAVRFFLTS